MLERFVLYLIVAVVLTSIAAALLVKLIPSAAVLVVLFILCRLAWWITR